MSARARRRGTLANAAEFREVFRRGRTTRTRNLIIHSLDRRDSNPGRYGLVVSKKVGGAVERNRARRRLRAAIGLAGGVAPGLDLVVAVKAARRPRVAEMTEEIASVMQDRTRQGRGEA